MTAAEPVPATGRVVVGVDGSDPSRRALRWGAFIARSMNVSMEAVITWNWGVAGYGPYPLEWSPGRDARAIIDQTVDAVFGPRDHPADLKITVLEGAAPKLLLDVSADAGMLVVGSRGHGGFAGLLLGSVSATCAEHADCPVLVVHGTTAGPPDVPEVGR